MAPDMLRADSFAALLPSKVQFGPSAPPSDDIGVLYQQVGNG